MSTATYPWACAWASAASLATHLAYAVCFPLALVAPSLYAAQCLAVSAALRASAAAAAEDAADESRLDEDRQLVDDANGLWRWPATVALLFSAAVATAGLRDVFARLLGKNAAVLSGGLHAAIAALALAAVLGLFVALLALRVNVAVDADGFDRRPSAAMRPLQNGDAAAGDDAPADGDDDDARPPARCGVSKARDRPTFLHSALRPAPFAAALLLLAAAAALLAVL